MADTANSTAARAPWYRNSTLHIFVGLGLGVVLGGFFPSDAHPLAYELFRFLSKAFIALIKGLIVPLLLSTIVVGIAQMGDLRAVGRVGGKALLYSRSSRRSRWRSDWSSSTCSARETTCRWTFRTAVSTWRNR